MFGVEDGDIDENSVMNWAGRPWQVQPDYVAGKSEKLESCKGRARDQRAARTCQEPAGAVHRTR